VHVLSIGSCAAREERHTQAPADRWNALSTRVHALLAGRDRPASGDFSEMVDLARALRRK